MLNPDRFKRLIQYVCNVCPNWKQLGTVKLNKIFWYADVEKYRRSRQTISGATYIKQEHGPVVKDHLRPATEALDGEGKIRVHSQRKFGVVSRQYQALTPVDVADVPAEDLEILSAWTHRICRDFTAPEISDLSHTMPWQLAAMGEEIPIYALLAEHGSVKPSAEAIQWAEKALSQLPPLDTVEFTPLPLLDD